MRRRGVGWLGASIASGLLASAPCGACSTDVAVDGSSSSGGIDGSSVVEGGGSASSSVAETSTDAAAPDLDAGSIQLIGRFDTRDPAGPKCAWPGCRILARFEGPSVSVDLNEIDETWMEGAPSEWDVSIDDLPTEKLVTTPGKKTYALASNLAAGAHEVELYKRTETQNGVTQLLGFDFGGGRLLAPPPRHARKIEIIGDSAPAGFGVEGVGHPDNDCPGLDYSARWQNFRRSFGALLGTTLEAEVHATVYSGKGMVKNIWRFDTDTMPLLFPLANPVDFTSTYDFAWKPDVVILMIGGNDFAEGQPDEADGKGPATPTEFTDAYRTFAQTLRTSYPDAHLFLTVSPSVKDEDAPAGRNPRTNISATVTTVTNERNAANDTKVYAFSPTVSPPSELTACNGHGSPAFHVRVAAELEAIVKEKTGW